ncbi:MAG: PaaX family transcriptional regulator C-terminal domain-containing protein [Chloroflexota bacterium]
MSQIYDERCNIALYFSLIDGFVNNGRLPNSTTSQYTNHMETDLSAVTRSANSTPFFIFNLFADYILPYKQGQAWTQELLYLLDLLGLSERAARTTLSRMKQQGWFQTVREGRRSRYELTEMGRRIIAEGDKRIFEKASTNWNGNWHLVVYSLPEEKRPLRNELRKKLVWFGFGNLAPGTWIAAHDRYAELKPIIDSLNIRQHLTLFTSQRVGFMSNQEIVTKCWNLPQLAADYNTFTARWQPEFERFTRQQIKPSPEACFKTRFWLTFDFQPFPRKDPNLPASLLPQNWPGHTARNIFAQYHDDLAIDLPNYFANLSN